MPSGGLLVRARYSWRSLRWAVVDAIADTSKSKDRMVIEEYCDISQPVSW